MEKYKSACFHPFRAASVAIGTARQALEAGDREINRQCRLRLISGQADAGELRLPAAE